MRLAILRLIAILWLNHTLQGFTEASEFMELCTKKKKIVMFALAIAWLRKDKETCNEERCIYLNQILFVVRSQTAAEFWIFWWLSVYLNFRIGKKYPKTLKVLGKWCSAFEHSKLISVNVWPNKKQKFCRAVLLIQLVYA